MAEAWRPWRGVAARLLWAYYAVLEGARGRGQPLTLRIAACAPVRSMTVSLISVTILAPSR